MAESFFSTLECELLARRRFHSQAEARIAVFRYVEGFYNLLRGHSVLCYRAPVVDEQQTQSNPLPKTLLSQAPSTVHGNGAIPAECGRGIRMLTEQLNAKGYPT